ncbi:MAG TPA: hypothetical protein VMI31_14065 [Fimbriimonadaceae bacterium]|nr:hypothetical protein [Fimbriimonadaceae bacterium]
MSLRSALSGIDGLRFLTPSEREEQIVSTGFEAKSVEASNVEGSEFRILDVPLIEESAFTHFLDGAQRSWQILYHRLSPVYVAHTSAAVLERVDGELQPPTDSTYRGGLEAFVPDDPALGDALRPHVPVVPVPIKDTHPGGLDEVVRKAISDRRDDLERDLAQRFGCLQPQPPQTRPSRENGGGGRLLIDGGLGNALRHQGEQPFVIGVVKSHRKQYFRSAKRTDAILGMKPGQRSTVFERPADAEQGESVCSFYLRLRESDSSGPLFGLVRVEMPSDEAYLAEADVIAGWILHERAPLSLPDPRFDKLLYPIRLVEQHLKARQPSTAAILGLIG